MSIIQNKLLRLNKMDGTFNYKKPCRELSSKERLWVRKYCILTNPEPVIKYPDCINGCIFTNFPCDCTKEMIDEHNFEKLDHYYEITKQSLTFMNKKTFEKQMVNITKKIGEHFLPYAWITISPKKHETKIANFRIAILLDKVLRQYFYECFRKTDKVHWCIEFGSEGNHAHCHILCRPIEAQQKSFIKNFARDFTTLWKKCDKHKCYKNEYVDILNLKSIAFDCKMLRRPEFIDEHLNYMKNNLKDQIHENPFDAEMFSKLNINKYENC